MAQLFGQEGHSNSFLFKLEPGSDWEAVKDRIEQALTPYGLISHYAREDQLAVSMVDEEIKQLEKMSGVVPFLFLTDVYKRQLYSCDCNCGYKRIP